MYVAVGCEKGVVRIWNVAKGTLVIGPPSSSANQISSLAWSPDGRHLAGAWYSGGEVLNTANGSWEFGIGGFAWGDGGQGCPGCTTAHDCSVRNEVAALLLRRTRILESPSGDSPAGIDMTT